MDEQESPESVSVEPVTEPCNDEILTDDSRRARERERKRVARASETVQERQERLEKAAEYKRKKKAEETEEEKEKRRKDSIEWKRVSLSKESEESSNNRRVSAADRRRHSLQDESEEDKRIRNSKDAELKRRARQVESEETANARRALDASRTSVIRSNESEEQANSRISKVSQKNSEKLQNMSEQEKDAHRAKKAESRRKSLLGESEEKGRQRREKAAMESSQKRKEETVEEKQNRLMSDAQRKLKKIQEEEDDARKKRLEKRKDRRVILDALKATSEKNRATQTSEDKLIYLGSMSQECENCQALFFKSEIQGKKKDKINFCCSSGTIKLEEHFADFPPQLQELFEGTDDPNKKERNEQSKNFKSNARQYNNSCAMASFGAKIDHTPNQGRAPYVMKVHGQIYHFAGPLHPSNGKNRSYGQLYILDSAQAAAERMQIPANSRCDVTIMQELSQLLTSINVFAQSYKLMHEVEKQEEIEALLAGRNPKPVQMVFDACKKNLDLRRYNEPTSNEVAVVFVQQDGQIPSRHIAAHARDGSGLVNIFDTDPIVDPMTYPLFFPRGILGWHEGLSRVNSTRKYDRVAQQPYYRYLAMIRKGKFNPIHYGANLTQQFWVDSWTKSEQNRLFFHRNNQDQIRAEEYGELRDFVIRGDHLTPGRRVILPSSFRGSPRAMIQEYQDSMVIMTKCGK